VWVASLLTYFSEGFYDYMFRPQIFITSMPIICTFVIIAIVIDNLL
jgi:hypothetical protein